MFTVGFYLVHSGILTGTWIAYLLGSLCARKLFSSYFPGYLSYVVEKTNFFFSLIFLVIYRTIPIFLVYRIRYTENFVTAMVLDFGIPNFCGTVHGTLGMVQYCTKTTPSSNKFLKGYNYWHSTFAFQQSNFISSTLL